MKFLIDVVTVTKDDFNGVVATIASTRQLRHDQCVRQLIVDSSDNATADRIRKLLADEKNVEYHWQPPSGIAAAFNFGIQNSSADWLWFLNGGDQVYAKLDQGLFVRILAATAADILIFELEGMQSGRRSARPPIGALWPPLSGNWVPHPATLVRSALFAQYGPFDTSYRIAMDAEWWGRVFNQPVQIDMLSMLVAHYDECGISSTNLADTERESRRILAAYFPSFLQWWLSRGRQLFQSRFLLRWPK